MASLHLWTLLVIYHPISFKFHVWITFIKLSPKFEYKFCPMNDNKMTTKMAAACWFAFVDTCQTTHMITFTKLIPKIDCGYYLTFRLL